MRIIIIFSGILFFLQLSVCAQELDDRIYQESIKTVLLYPGNPAGDDPRRMLRQPVIPLDSNVPLTLEFDELSNRAKNFRAKLIHCNADWTQSSLSEVEYTFEYNDYPVTSLQASFSTKVPYYHYTWQVPKVRVSGNYVLVIYENRQPVLSRRFMVYEPKVRVHGGVTASEGIAERRTSQQINFSIDHKGYQLASPQTELQVVLRKNFRWDQAKSGFKPTNVNAFDQTLGFQFFRLENNFPGGNEFRYFDSRTTAGRGFGIAAIERGDDYTELMLQADQPRRNAPYFQSDDFNGQFVVDHRESKNGSLQADYNPVTFTLKMEEIPDRDVYVNGAFNLWQLNDINIMHYDPELKAYQAVIMLKQGVTNYEYVVSDGTSIEDGAIEGNFSDTENDYDILIYHRPPAGRADQLIGYQTFEWNRR